LKPVEIRLDGEIKDERLKQAKTRTKNSKAYNLEQIFALDSQ
jgi:hypothetical protein